MNTSASLFAVVDSDVWRIRGNKSLKSKLRALIANRPFKAILSLRLCQAVAKAPAPIRYLLPLCIVVHQAVRHYCGMDLPWQTRIGAALSIQHGWGLVLNAGCSLGNNITLYHGVTIGQADRLSSDGTRSTGYPVIEDDVWIGPHAIVVGGITIGQGSRILGGAFVTEDVPPFSLVRGNPAQIKPTHGGSDVLNKFPIATACGAEIANTLTSPDRSPA